MKNFEQAIEKYLAADTMRKQSGAKGAITRLANDRAAEIGVIAARKEIQEILSSFSSEDLPHWLRHRFQPGSFYHEGDRVMGWWDEMLQVQAQKLPLVQSEKGYHVSFYACSQDTPLWNERGFGLSESLPVRRMRDGLIVDISLKKTLFWLEYGYALPCKLQWHRGSFDGLVGQDECLWVERSILSAGYWQAWKWWGTETKYWYLEKRPELFNEMTWWGELEAQPIRYEPEDDPYAVVLGKQ